MLEFEAFKGQQIPSSLVKKASRHVYIMFERP